MFEKGIDLDPTEVNCCGWTKKTALSVMGFKPLPPKLCGLESYNADGTEKGVELMEACCEGMEMLDCDHLYRPSGMAWEDIAEFARDEQLWLRTYT